MVARDEAQRLGAVAHGIGALLQLFPRDPVAVILQRQIRGLSACEPP
ncbi:MAG: hypothetical protein JOZ04_07795 [Acidimicrobiia bacterium]|nr:hypothetical protein [Acidimicrobiia bacterium]